MKESFKHIENTIIEIEKTVSTSTRKVTKPAVPKRKSYLTINNTSNC